MTMYNPWPWHYKLQISLVPLYPNLQRQILDEQPPCMWCGGFFCNCAAFSSGYTGSLLYQGMGQPQQFEPSPGPSRWQNQNELRKAESPYFFNQRHESSGAFSGEGSTGFYPGGQAWTVAKNSGNEKVWRTPSKNPFIVDRNFT